MQPVQNGRRQAGCPPQILVTDGLNSFVTVTIKIFWRMGVRFVPVSEIHMCDQFNHNNMQERLNGEFKNRLVTTRGLNADEPALVT